MTKLTLSVDEKVVEEAKRIAQANGTSVSAMFSEFVRSMAGRRGRRPAIGPLTRKLSGVASVPPGKSYRELVDEALMEKYGLPE